MTDEKFEVRVITPDEAKDLARSDCEFCQLVIQKALANHEKSVLYRPDTFDVFPMSV